MMLVMYCIVAPGTEITCQSFGNEGADTLDKLDEPINNVFTLELKLSLTFIGSITLVRRGLLETVVWFIVDSTVVALANSRAPSGLLSVERGAGRVGEGERCTDWLTSIVRG